MTSYVKVEKITDLDLLQWACSMTIDSESEMSLERIYRNEHSPMRTQLFKISMFGLPTFVSTHFMRHPIGVVAHFGKTLRDDRGGPDDANRWTPTNHGMICNAQALINMARKRLCFKSHHATVRQMRMIRDGVMAVDPDLAYRMVPECLYRGGICHEDKPCGKRKNILTWKEALVERPLFQDELRKEHLRCEIC